MAVKKINQTTSDNPIKDMGYLDFVYIERDETGKLNIYGDMYFTFEVRPETASKDINVLRALAHNTVLDYINSDEDGTIPCVEIQNGDVTFEIVTTELDQECMDYLRERYPDCRIDCVKKTDSLMEIPEDTITESYHAMQVEIENDISYICNYLCSAVPENEKYPVKLVGPIGMDIDAISHHIGIDGQQYFVLHSGDNTTPGMDEQRMQKEFKGCNVADIEKVHSSVHALHGRISEGERLNTIKTLSY